MVPLNHTGNGNKRCTLYRARYVLAFVDGSHRLLRDGEVAVQGEVIEHVGKRGSFPRDADLVVDLGHSLIAPGLVNVHCHTPGAPFGKSVFEDAGSPGFFMTGLYDYGHIPQATEEEGRTVVQYSLIELLKSGCTTVAEVGGARHMDLFEEVGIRACLIPSYRAAQWTTTNGSKLNYDWDEQAGFEGLRRNVDWIEKLGTGDGDGLMWSALGPAQVDTCGVDLLKETRRAADALGCRIHIHGAQSHVEVPEMMARTGMSSLQFLESVGLLGPDMILGHGIFTSAHPDANLGFTRDFELLGEYGVNLAHCPWVFGRRGTLLHSFRRCLDQGINVGIGTDCCPQDMVTEMRWAAILGKTADNNPLAVTAGDAFHAATAGGADVLGREDIGRLRPGGKADMIFVDCDAFGMVPVRDPIKALVYSAGSVAIDGVMVAGRMLVEDGQVLGLDEKKVASEMQRIGEKMWETAPERDRVGRTVDEMSPPSFAWLDE